MSLIQDALKRKREEEALLPPSETPAPSDPPTVEPFMVNHDEPEPAEPKGNPKPVPDKLLISLILLIVVSLISIGLIKFFRSSPAATSARNEPDVAVVENPAPTPAPAEKKPLLKFKDGWPELKLTGFASAGGQRMVVINGKMLSTGSRIQGVRVIEVGEEKVVVEYQGKQKTLYANDQ